MKLDNLRLAKLVAPENPRAISDVIIGPHPRDGEKGIWIYGGEWKLWLSEKTLSKGILAIGGPGCGKTVFISQLVYRIAKQITDDDILIIFDAKGDYRDKFFNASDPHCVLISSRESDAARSMGWNIFGELLDREGNFGSNTAFLAEQLSKQLFSQISDKNQPLFTIGPEKVFSRILLAFVLTAERTGDYTALNNEALRNFFTVGSDTVKERIHALLESVPDYHGEVKSYIGEEGEQGNITAMGILACLQSVIDNTFTGNFGKRMPGGDVSMRRLVREKGGKTIFLEYDSAHEDALGPIYSALIDIAVNEAESISKGNTYIICDEAAKLPFSRALGDAPNFGRGLGLKMVLGLQNVNQLEKNYGQAAAKSIMAGYVNAFCFHASDPETRHYICERFGAADSTADDLVIKDAGIKSLEEGECFVDLDGERSFRFKPNLVYD